MVYVTAKKSDDGVAKVIYTSKDRKSKKVFNALDWLAGLVTHIPGRYEHTVRYYGYFSNKSRGMRKKADADDTISTIMPNELSSNEARQNWARLIQKIYEVDPQLCFSTNVHFSFQIIPYPAPGGTQHVVFLQVPGHIFRIIKKI